jgi:retron-type reverse transcriptase
MYNIIYKKNVLQRYRTKREAQRELDDRSSLCYMLRVNPSEEYSIRKEKLNATKRNGFRKTWPML